MKRFFLALLGLVFLSGCAVVKNADYATLSNWKLSGDEAYAKVTAANAQPTDVEAYKDTEGLVNGWLTQKQTEITAAGAGWFDTIDLKIPDELQTKVKTYVVEHKDIADIAQKIADFLAKLYGEGRKESAGEANARLKIYMWTEIKPAPAPTGPKP